jgi:hypothetical protein
LTRNLSSAVRRAVDLALNWNTILLKGRSMQASGNPHASVPSNPRSGHCVALVVV